MHATTRAAHPDEAAAIELFDLVVSGPLRRVEANADGSWTVTPVTGRPLILTGAAEVAAYVDQTTGTGPTALVPAPAPAAPSAVPSLVPSAASAAEEPPGCGCVPAARAVPTRYEADMMQARAIAARLAEYGVRAARRSAAYDTEQQAAAVRVSTGHGTYTLLIPPPRRRYAVMRNGQRDGALSARRIPADTDSKITTLFAYYLRDRGAL